MTVLTFDGSLTGGGATLQCGVRHRDEIAVKLVIAFWADQCQDHDLALLKVQRGDPAGQARVEAYTLLGSVATRRHLLINAQGSLTNVADALGILHDAAKLKSKDPVLNAIMGEIALLIAPLGADSRTAHSWVSAECHLRCPEPTSRRRSARATHV